jgi:hypothetical protein
VGRREQKATNFCPTHSDKQPAHDPQMMLLSDDEELVRPLPSPPLRTCLVALLDPKTSAPNPSAVFLRRFCEAFLPQLLSPLPNTRSPLSQLLSPLIHTGRSLRGAAFTATKQTHDRPHLPHGRVKRACHLCRCTLANTNATAFPDTQEDTETQNVYTCKHERCKDDSVVGEQFCAVHLIPSKCKRCSAMSVLGSTACRAHGGAERCEVPGCLRYVSSDFSMCVAHVQL